MKIAFFTTKFRNQGGTYNSFLELKKEVAGEVDCYCIGKKRENEVDFKFINSEKDIHILDNYDIVHMFKLWNYEGKEWLTKKLIELARKKKLVLTIHDVKDVQSTSKTNVSAIFNKLCKENLIVIFHGKEEMNFYTERYPIKYYYYVPHPYHRKDDWNLIRHFKDKIVVVSRIDFCKGIEFIHKFMKQGLLKYPIEFWSGNVNDAFAYFSGVDELLKTSAYKGGFEGTKEDYDKIYQTARVLLNFTWWGEGSGGRTEMTMLEAWDYGVIPFVDKRWCSVKDSILKDGYNCMAIERNNYKELAKKLDLIFNDHVLFKKMKARGFKTLNEIMKNNKKINEVYSSIYNDKLERKQRNTALFDE